MASKTAATIGGFLLIAALLTAAPGLAAPGPSYLVTSGGWQLERFGGQVTILRTTLIAPATGGRGLLVLSCDGAERRLRIVLPEAIKGASMASEGRLMAQATGNTASSDPTSRPPSLTARFALDRGRVLNIPDSGAAVDGTVLRFARLIQARPQRLELLMHTRPGAITFRDVQAYVISLSPGDGDAIALDNFVSGCRQDAR